jgi:hypothetical protein
MMGSGHVDVDVILTLAHAAVAGAGPRARAGPDPLGDALEAAVDAVPPGEARRSLLIELAARRPDLVLRRATDWLADGDTDVLVRLPEHWLRLAVAGALRPWSQGSIDAVITAVGDDIGEGTPLARVMADDYPALTRPSGLEEGDHRWHVIATEPWEWSLWRDDHGRHALEVVKSSGHADLFLSELVDEALVERWRNEGPEALEAAVERIRSTA